MSLYKKLCLVVAVVMCLAVVPVLAVVYTTVSAASLKREQRSFFNISEVLAIDMVDTHFLLMHASTTRITDMRNLLRGVAEGVSRDLDQIARLPKITMEERLQALRFSGAHLSNRYFFTEIRLPGELGILRNFKAEALEGMRIRDVKGRTLSEVLAHLPVRGDYAVFELPGEDNTKKAYLGHCQRVLTPGLFKDSVIIVSTSIDDLEQVAEKNELRIRNMVSEKLSQLQLRKGAGMALLDKQGQVLAYHGSELPQEDFLHLVNEHVALHPEDSHVDSVDGTDVLVQSRYIKVLDWRLVNAVPLRELSRMGDRLAYKIVGIGALVLALALGLGMLGARQTLKPLRLLTRRLGEFQRMPFQGYRQDGVFHHDLLTGLPVTRKDEIGQVARAFADMAEDLSRGIRKLVLHSEAEERLLSELRVAGDIQKAMLPEPVAEGADWSLAGSLESASEVGGDFYDHFVLPDGKLALVLGGVPVKGAGAALFMSRAATLVRYALRYEGGDSTDDAHRMALALDHINRILAANTKENMCVALFVAVYDPGDGTLHYINAGLPAVRIVSEQGLRMVTGEGGPPPGRKEVAEYTVNREYLAAGELLCCYSPGVTSVMRHDGERFGEARLDALLQERCSREGGAAIEPERLARSVQASVESFLAGTPRSVDLTLLFLLRGRDSA